jgi:hypothetical protein
MKKINYILGYVCIVVFCIGCENIQQKNVRYAKEQIESLHLDSTLLLKIQTDSLTIIDMNPFLGKKSFDFGDFIKDVKLLPLESTDESLVANIYKVLVTDSFVYVMDDFNGSGLIIFKRDGIFVKRISNGQGPGELTKLYDIAFDSTNNELIAYQHPFLLFFTQSGEYIGQTRLPFGFYNFTVIPDGYVFKSLDSQGNEHLGTFQDYTLLVTDKNFKLKHVGMYFLQNDINYGGYNYLYDNHNDIKVTQRFTDTIYQFVSTTNELKAKYLLNYDSKHLPDRYLKGNRQQFYAATSQNDYYYNLGKYLESDNHNAFFLENNIRGQTVVYRNKKTGRMIGGSAANYHVNEIPPIAFPIASCNEYFISSVLPDDEMYELLLKSTVISNEDKNKLKGIKDEDNPILVFFRLKDF